MHEIDLVNLQGEMRGGGFFVLFHCLITKIPVSLFPR